MNEFLKDKSAQDEEERTASNIKQSRKLHLDFTKK